MKLLKLNNIYNCPDTQCVTDVHSYDVNSLYPFAMKKPMPFELIKEYRNMDDIKLENFFGFALARIEAPDMLIPLLPCKFEDRTIFPTGFWEGVYFSEELKEVIKYGYKVTLIKGYEFSTVDLFSEYVDHFYGLKATTDGAERFIAKMHLNQLYGIFGRKQDIIETINVYKKDLPLILTTKIVKSIIDVDVDKVTLLILKNVNTDVLSELNSILESKLNSDFSIVKSNVAIASAVTAYARIHMMQFKLDGSIVYTDTDSLYY